MMWSKLKKTIEDLLADSLKDRVQFYITQYGNSGYATRGWITLDGKEIANFATMEWDNQYRQLVKQLEGMNKLDGIGGQRARVLADSEAKEILEKKGLFTRWEFYPSLENYVELSIEEALESEDTVIKAIAMFDRRLGKRRLKDMEFTGTEPDLVKSFYELRCKAEGLPKEPVKNDV